MTAPIICVVANPVTRLADAARNLGQRRHHAIASRGDDRSVKTNASPAASASLHRPAKIIRAVGRAWMGIRATQALNGRFSLRAAVRVRGKVAKLRRRDNRKFSQCNIGI